MTTIFDLQRATLAARARLGDKAIGTRVAAGRVEIVRVTYTKRGNGEVVVLSGPHTAAEAVAALGAL